MDDIKKVDNAIDEINKMLDEGVLQNLSSEQLSKLSELIDEIQKKLSK